MTRLVVRLLGGAATAGALCLSIAVAAVQAQAPAPAAPASARPAPRAGQVESDPIRCWWKTDRTSVRVGEALGLTLTCGVIETGPVAVVPSLTQLEGGAIQLTPFEVMSATRRADVVVPPWRYVQFEYAVRLLNDGFFGQDVNIPALTLTYNLKSAGSDNTGRDQSYVLPALQMRILSLVPRGAADIRDASSLTFADIESRRFASTAARVAAGIALVFAAVFAVLALLRFTQRFRTRIPASARVVPQAALLAGCAASLRDVQKDVRASGWSPDLARRAMPALRLAGAAALGRPIAQQWVSGEVVEREGQVLVRSGWKRTRAVISASTTATAITQALEPGRGLGARARAALTQLGESLKAFAAAAYTRQEQTTLDAGVLDRALDEAIEAVGRLRTGQRWPMRLAHSVTRTFAGV
jgi:hypothetical protein